MIHYEQSIFSDLRVQFVRRKLSALRAENSTVIVARDHDQKQVLQRRVH
jgi:hypothetical protein